MRIETCSILGINIAVTNMQDTVSFLCENLEELSGRYLCVTNVHTLIVSQDDPEYKKIQNDAVMALPDGSPLSKIQRRRGYKNASRVTGPDLMGEIFKLSCDRKFTHYFYGSTKETLSILKERLEKRYPGIRILGMEAPPFRPQSEEEDLAVIERINQADADFIWVGLGAPKQERWMAQHKNLFRGVMLGVGAGFSYQAGTLKRAPWWMQKLTLEWLYRLLQEPRRLFKRYLVTNSRFLWLIMKESWNESKSHD